MSNRLFVVFSPRFLRGIAKIQRPEEALRFLRHDRYWSPEVAARLLARVDQLVPLKPRRALGLAEIALELVQRIRNAPQDLQAHAYCALAATQKATGKLDESESNFRTAERLAQSGPPTLKAMVRRQKALLLLERGQLELALESARAAVELDRSAEAFPLKSLMIEGIIRDLQEDIAGALKCFQEVLEHADPAGDEYLFATNSLVVLLMKRPLLGTEIVRVRKDLRRVQNRIRGVRETPVRYILWHAEGRFHLQMEEYRQAIDHFLQARSGFLRIELIADFARVSVDLIDALVKKGEDEKARIIIERTIRQIEDFPGNTNLAEAFQIGRDHPTAEAVDMIRKRLSAG